MLRVETVKRPNPLLIARKAVVGAVGATVVGAGVVMLVTPGPGILAIVAGLGILGTEFAAAKRMLNRLRRRDDNPGNP